MKSSFIKGISFEIFGGSHESEIGITVKGLPAGFKVDLEALNRFMKRRAPGTSDYVSSRKESDDIEFKSGIENGVLTGEPLTAVIKNNDIRKSDYTAYKYIPRPSHADYTAYVKYGDVEDISGGGHFSGRMTAPLCVLGGICIQILKAQKISVLSRISEIGGIKDEGELHSPLEQNEFYTVSAEAGAKMQKIIFEAKLQGDSVGGVVECKIIGAPAGIGEAMFGGLESRISELVFGIPAVKGIEFGSGFGGSRLSGSENNDEFTYCGEKVVTKTNNCGGILGGISNGMPIVFKTAFKPTPTISKPQNTVDLKLKQNTVIKVSGRHDPCIVPRALTCVEAAAAIAVLNAIYETYGNKNELLNLRSQMDATDNMLTALFERRMEISSKIAEYKLQNGIKILDKSRENQKLEQIAAGLPKDLKNYGKELYKLLFEVSRDYQEKQLGNRTDYGLLGQSLSHSFSPLIHKLLGGYDYRLFESDNPAEFFKSVKFKGVNVCIPYKKVAARYVDVLSETAKQTGCVNVAIKKDNGKLYGYNTDVDGFAFMLKQNGIIPEGKSVVVLGSGGASAAVCLALKRLKAAEITVISRSGKDNYGNIEKHAEADIIVNATPVGMYPDNGKSPVSLDCFKKLEAVVDLIYNPQKTKLLLEAEKLGIKAVNGLLMLVAQAAYTTELFLKVKIPEEKIISCADIVAKKMQNIILIGMPGCGKSRIAKALGELCGREVIDIDFEITKRYKKTPADIINQNGEGYFRKIESEILMEKSALCGKIIATGGGAVVRAENYEPLHQNGKIIYLKRDVKALSRKGRPLSSSNIEKLFCERAPLYNSFEDVSVDVLESSEKTAMAILEVIK